MKYNIKEIQRSLEILTKSGGPTEVEINIDPMERLVLTFTDFDGDQVSITIFQSSVNMMAKITRTTRL